MADAMQRHLQDLARWQAESSVYSRRRFLIRLAGQLPVPLLEATHEDLLAWRDGMRLAPASIASYISHAREFYAWCVDAGLVGANPVLGIRVPPVPELLPRPIAEDDLARAVLTAPQPVRLMLVLAGWAGLRAKEIALLRRSNLLLNADPPVLRVAWNATKGFRERDVPICTFVHSEMDLLGLPQSRLVFRRPDGGRGPWSPATVSKYCNDHLHGLGIAETLHCARHRFATRMLELDPDLRRLQQLLGHKNPATTAIYTLVNLRSAAAVVERLPVPVLRAA